MVSVSKQKATQPMLQVDSFSPQGRRRDFSTFGSEQKVFQDSIAKRLNKPLISDHIPETCRIKPKKDEAATH